MNHLKYFFVIFNQLSLEPLPIKTTSFATKKYVINSKFKLFITN